MLGIYCYIDKQDGSIVYIGKDSYIDKQKRYKDHMYPSNYNQQPFNRVLQNNKDRYEYHTLIKNVPNQDTLNELEQQHIKHLKPKFNYTKGGDGLYGFTHSEATRQKLRESHLGKKLSLEQRKKISEANSGKNHPFYGKNHTIESRKKMSESLKGHSPWNKGKTNVYSNETLQRMSKVRKGKYCGEDHPFYGKHHTNETKQKISESKKGHTPWNKGTKGVMKSWNKGKHHSKETVEKLSKAHNTSGYFRVSICKNNRMKNKIQYIYAYFEDGKQRKLASVDLDKLKEKVIAKGLEWRRVN